MLVVHDDAGVELGVILPVAACQADARTRHCRIARTFGFQRGRGCVFSHPGMGSWSENAAGRPLTVSPWRLVEYWSWTKAPDLGDYEWVADTPGTG